MLPWPMSAGQNWDEKFPVPGYRTTQKMQASQSIQSLIITSSESHSTLAVVRDADFSVWLKLHL